MTTYRVDHPNGLTVRSDDDDDDSVEEYQEGDEIEDPPEEIVAAFGDRLVEVESEESAKDEVKDAGGLEPRGVDRNEEADTVLDEEQEAEDEEEDEGN